VNVCGTPVYSIYISSLSLSFFQVYLYEINKLLQPSSHPRQILPYAVVTFTLDGVHNPTVDIPDPVIAGVREKQVTIGTEATGGNTKLQQIIDQINSRTEGGRVVGGGNERDEGTNPQMFGRMGRVGGGFPGSFSDVQSDGRDWKETEESPYDGEDDTEAGRLKKVRNFLSWKHSHFVAVLLNLACI